MTWLRRALLLGLAASIMGAAQEPSARSAKAAPANDIFSGTITALTSNSVTVVRKVPAKPDILRTFAFDSQTRVEGQPLKLKARVTVRFQSAGDGQYQALNIIVR